MTPQERADEIEAAEGPKLRALVAEAVKLAGSLRVPFPQKAERFIDIADAIGRAITPHTPCANGCSHCCHMATAVSGYEAAMIGRYIGRDPVKLHRANLANVSQNELVDRYTGIKCPFLSMGGLCTVYPVRPIACRIHHSVNDTAHDCEIVPGSAPVAVPRINLSAFISVQALAFLPDDYGDIREFFPTPSPNGL